MKPNALLLVILFSIFTFFTHSGEDRNSLVHADKKKMEADASWIYNDPDKAFEEAKKSGKPLMVVMRCIPCIACKVVDEDVAARDKVLKDLMDQFLCLRIVQANNLDLTLYQYDYDMSWAVLFMNADKTVYARFGSKFEQKNGDVNASLKSLRLTMEAALAAHKNYPANKEDFAGKQPKPTTIARPEQYPKLKDYGPKLDYAGNVVKSCMHCHMIRDAERDANRASNTLDDKILEPYPLPETIGISLDPAAKCTVAAVKPGTLAEKAGIKANDEITRLDGQPMYSPADLAWALHQFKSGALKLELKRGTETPAVTLDLPENWRIENDLSWRVSTWNMRRMALGGMLLETLTGEERKALALEDDQLGLRAKHVGQYGEHAIAKNAGILKGDILIEFGGFKENLTESQLIVNVLKKFKSGDTVTAKIVRNDKKMEMTLKLP